MRPPGLDGAHLRPCTARFVRRCGQLTRFAGRGCGPGCGRQLRPQRATRPGSVCRDPRCAAISPHSSPGAAHASHSPRFPVSRPARRGQLPIEGRRGFPRRRAADTAPAVRQREQACGSGRHLAVHGRMTALTPSPVLPRRPLPAPFDATRQRLHGPSCVLDAAVPRRCIIPLSHTHIHVPSRPSTPLPPPPTPRCEGASRAWLRWALAPTARGRARCWTRPPFPERSRCDGASLHASTHTRARGPSLTPPPPPCHPRTQDLLARVNASMRSDFAMRRKVWPRPPSRYSNTAAPLTLHDCGRALAAGADAAGRHPASVPVVG